MKLTLLVLSLMTTTALAGSTWCNRGQHYCGWDLNKYANPPSTPIKTMQSIYATTPVAIKVSSGVAHMDVLTAQPIAIVDLLSRKDIGQLHYL
ncbi:hypothetical protein N7530_010596 [Penicillium desertorum]|uniref:Uncharacterized protein n=1 Tax=Penicillium desertorum TaxID=1303715 RepID=A0A9W9WHV5_9EURO|nr:hypothetical protein N7530_010596 [Penicillium desertorum]